MRLLVRRFCSWRSFFASSASDASWWDANGLGGKAGVDGSAPGRGVGGGCELVDAGGKMMDRGLRRWKRTMNSRAGKKNNDDESDQHPPLAERFRENRVVPRGAERTREQKTKRKRPEDPQQRHELARPPWDRSESYTNHPQTSRNGVKFPASPPNALEPTTLDPPRLEQTREHAPRREENERHPRHRHPGSGRSTDGDPPVVVWECVEEHRRDWTRGGEEKVRDER